LETIAVYWEARVKTYGFQEETDLSLLEIIMERNRIGEWGRLINEAGGRDIPFLLCLIQSCGGGGLHIFLLLKREGEEVLLKRLTRSVHAPEEGSIHVTAPVEMIHFQGPHFGDRHGIADAAFKALEKGGIPVLAAACSGSSIYLVLPEKKARPAGALLEEVFEVPNRRRRTTTRS
jgi:aspartokinase